MTILQQESRRQLERFLRTLFLPDELIELRFIESWVSHGKKKSRVVRTAEWLRCEEFVSLHGEITDFARRKRANVYFGVCPRAKKGHSQDDHIRTVRCLWCDIDDITVKDASRRWDVAGVPRPSIVVISGSGIHAYWLLDHDTPSREERSLISAMLPHFYRSFGGDHVQNLSRVLRPPGTVNCKDARNDRPTQSCMLCTCLPELRYPLAAFSEWIDQAERHESRELSPSQPRLATNDAAQEVLARNAEATALVRQLGEPARDRSRRDFAIACDLLRLGLTREEIWPLVSDSSKFKSNGRPYFDVTIANAEKRILFDPHTAGR